MRQGMPLKDAVVEGGAVRFRAMLLTALAVVVGSSVMLADPIFQGMAIALMAGEVASTLLSWGAIPILYVLFYGDKPPVHDEAFEEEDKNNLTTEAQRARRRRTCCNIGTSDSCPFVRLAPCSLW